MIPFLVTAVLLAGAAFAQEIPNNPSAKDEQLEAPASGLAPVNEGHERILGVMPAFGVTNQRQAPPLTAHHKLGLAARQAFDPFVWVSAGVQAGASQVGNEFPEYGQGTRGFEKRYGAAMLDAVTSGLASSGFCVVLKQDPRYFRLGEGSTLHRAFYSMAQQLSAKSDTGKRQVNWSNILGMLVGTSLSNAYYPRPERGLGLTMNRFGIGLAWGVTGGLADEFWADIDRRFFHKEKTHQ
jgi:hypothetical protein